ncbi:MAG: sialate O-acetylesterase [Candidatus Latescibacteria bacterium]|nr:sialate O-acetylesterase [Candidatus Latescibacterota bacterium]
MKITQGLLPGQVLQRTAQNQGQALISGRARNGVLEYRLLKNGQVLAKFAWARVGTVVKRQFEFLLEGVPCGGPYQVELRVKDQRKIIDMLTVDDIFVGDVWIAAGQSNMQGVGNLVDAPRPHPQVRAFYTRDEWAVAVEPVHFLAEAVDVFHNGYGTGPDRPRRAALEKARKATEKGVSPALAFALDMRRRTRVPQGIIACAHGGTSMAQWSPALRGEGGASLYGAMLRRYEKLGQPVAGVLWYQGESDADKEAAEVYTEKMKNLVQSSRDDMGLANLPWLVVQIGCHAAPDGKYWNSIQEQQRLLVGEIDYLDVAPAVDLSIDDGIHISGVGQQILGRRLARLAWRLVFKGRGEKGSIYLKAISVGNKSPKPGDPVTTVVELEYGHVKGKLQSLGLPAGFTITNAEGAAIPCLYKTTLRGNRVFLETGQSAAALQSLSVSYGHGRQPYCNIIDAEGLSLPAMHNVSMQGPG